MGLFGKKKETTNPGFLNKVKEQSVDRRANVRAKYPQTGGMGVLPEVTFNETKLWADGISKGGIGILAPPEALPIGSEISINLIWPTRTYETRVTIVNHAKEQWGATFVDLDPAILVELSLALKPAYRGQAMKQIPSKDIDIEGVSELWRSKMGDQVTFFESGPYQAEVVYTDKVLRLNKDLKPFDKDDRPSEAKDAFRRHLVVFLANLTSQTSQSSSLTERLAAHTFTA